MSYLDRERCAKFSKRVIHNVYILSGCPPYWIYLKDPGYERERGWLLVKRIAKLNLDLAEVALYEIFSRLVFYRKSADSSVSMGTTSYLIILLKRSELSSFTMAAFSASRLPT